MGELGSIESLAELAGAAAKGDAADRRWQTLVGGTPDLQVQARDALRLAYVADSLLRKRPLQEIAATLSISVATVQVLGERCRREWEARALAATNVIRAEELAKLDALEAELWSRYERSRQQSTKTSRKLEPRGRKPDGSVASFVETEAKVDTEQPIGDIRGLVEGLLRCMERRARLLGLDLSDRLTTKHPQFDATEDAVTVRIREYAVQFNIPEDDALALFGRGIGRGSPQALDAASDRAGQSLDSDSADSEAGGILDIGGA
jgi:hypothetical protein